jgi:hypothetical protein
MALQIPAKQKIHQAETKRKKTDFLARTSKGNDVFEGS